MKYNLKNKPEQQAAFDYLKQLVEKEAIAVVKKVNPKRSLSQNNYLHLIIGAFGQHFGYTMEEAKQIYKEMSPNLYQYRKKGRTFLRSSAELNKEEMAKSIDRFMEKSKEAGYPLPLATDQEWIRQIENEIERSGYYL
jgi:hypothetical protein